MRKIFIAGDSTASIKEKQAYPETGWGEAFRFMLSNRIELRDYAVNGRSTKSFITDGLFDKIDKEIEAGDYLLIQFGHNDGKIDDEMRYTDPTSEYPENLVKYINMARKHNATPILLTSISRRMFENGTLVENNIGPYPNVMRKVAQDEDVLLLDINRFSEALLKKIGDQESKKLHLHIKAGEHPNYPEGIEDNTHFSPLGAWTYAYEIAKLLKQTELGKDIYLPY
ncbi:rhamnogalacturonan acetylesterase [Aerococcaceae bacterium zg-ZUI334]|uniref:rhamnogalacturonan acetylesterase n=1 Tax=Aerococcaceae TaxID=186827 RepID=UPI0013B90D1B|nr:MULTISPECIES: rhamnogalacturonan acetylesterase [unclassified Facklamia]MBR7928033.1 rhamnogalacturonan acetylesterase [Aerococcaceae bacterium zg-ZUI334]NEW65083.1 rhamnogalacturonan acetylesterase [Facklamia sp. 252]NEW68687.1 rhamnogalacturonan acetylesterase [Facklamia sp. 253]QQD65480.1 rhamnogalacturonan acetylesterase [Aerococcaceae bacterium zg-252]